MRTRILLLLWCFVFCSDHAPTHLRNVENEVTAAQIDAAFAAYKKAKADNFSIESMVAIYQLENAAGAIKKLVDAAQSNPERSISPADSGAMEATRDRMNQMVLDHLARVTGGTVEVINFGKQNGIRSDKDQTIYAVDGKRVYGATEMKKAYEDHFKTTFGIDMEAMDMSMFDGDAAIPDWRKADMSFEEFVTRYEAGQAKLEQNPEAYQEAGTFRAQVDGRTASQGRVRVTRINPDTEKIEVLNGTAAEISSRYADWTADVPYRNAMDSSVENKGRFDHADDFIDKMKYFNRTIGNGLNALALENWNVNYIFHLNDMESAGERRRFIRQMIDDTYQTGVSAAERAVFSQVIEIAAQIEIDKINSRTQGEEHYLKSLIAVEEKNARSRGEEAGSDELLSRARKTFFDLQSKIMDRNIVETTRQKLLRDFDPAHLKKVARKYGKEQARKLRWETARQIQRAFEKIEDPKLIAKLLDETPKNLRAEVEGLRDIARVRKLSQRELDKKPIKLEKGSAAKAKSTGPEEKVISKKTSSFLERRRQEAEDLKARMKARFEEYESALRSGAYSDDAISERLRNRLLDSLGFEERMTFEDMEADYQLKFSGSKLLKNVVNLGNVNSVISCIQVYQQTGDLTKVAQTALWEIVSNFPGVSQAATLKQSFHDGNYQSLSWLFIAWQLPAAGQVKMVFDVVANTLQIVYDHAMTPLANDRFSKVYMGYVEKQPAGWSPLTPGWKERRDAAGLSILQFVPGDTFAEKRTNMYEYFQAQLDARLQRNGYDPTTTRYFERRDQILEPFFGNYVKKFFNAEGEFKDNTTVGLYAIGEQDKLKARLIATLKKDFIQGELNYRLAEVAKEDLNKAIAAMAEQQKQNIQVERELLNTSDFIVAKLKKRVDEAMSRLSEADLAPTVEDNAKIKIEAYPSTVMEGQESRIAVRALSMNNDVGGEKHVIEIKKLRPTSLVKGEADVAGKLDETIEEVDRPLVAGLKKKAQKDAELFVTKMTYAVTVKDSSGRILEEENVSLNLAALGGKKIASGGSSGVMMRITRPDPDSHRLARKSIVTWEEPTPQNCTQAQISQGMMMGGTKSPYLWIRWPDMPDGKHFGYRIRARGAVPYFDIEKILPIRPRTKLDADPRSELGNGFAMSIPLPKDRTVGDIEIDGELLLFDQYTNARKMPQAKPRAKHPFTARLTIHDEPLTVIDASAYVNRHGWVSGSLKLKWRQVGRRVAQVSGGGSNYYGMFDGYMAFTLPNTTSVPGAVTLRFMDYGKQASMSVPLKAGKPLKRNAKDTSRVGPLLTEIEALKSRGEGQDIHIYEIANRYRACADYFEFGGQHATELSKWAEYRLLEIKALQTLLRRGANPSWKGYKHQQLEYEGRWIHKMKDAAKQRDGVAHVKKIISRRIFDRLQRMTEIYTNHWKLEEARRYIQQAEEAIAAIGDDVKWAAEPRRSLSFRYTKLARLIFNTSGSLSSAQSVFERGQDLKRDYARMTGKEFRKAVFEIKLDEEFENSARPRPAGKN